MKYTEEQLIFIASQVKNNPLIHNVFNVLVEAGTKGLNMKEIGEKAGLGAFARDKAIMALEFADLITKQNKWSSKIYEISGEGQRLQAIIEGEIIREKNKR